MPQKPFDIRLKRLIMTTAIQKNSKGKTVSLNNSNNGSTFFTNTPYSELQSATSGLHPDPDENYTSAQKKKIKQSKDADAKKWEFQGSQALIMPYATTRLYGSKGPEFLLDFANKRRWYEINDNDEDPAHFALNPTTKNIITWGNSDEHGRTPYSYQDFVFCKFWNKVPNNRLLTLRRYASPILDNLNFPNTNGKSNANSANMFPPITSALSYFGEDTGNKLSDILKFTTGLNWSELAPDSTPMEATGNQESVGDYGAGLNNVGFPNIGKGLTSFGTVMGILGASPQNTEVASYANLPDPFKDGPYNNVILGPINVISKVMKRDRGLNFTMDGLKIKFSYVSRPIGGINSKAALLDLLANMLVLCSASAVFWGGAHRFMVNPAEFPFPSDKSRDQLYNGEILKSTGTLAGSYFDGLGNASGQNSILTSLVGIFNGSNDFGDFTDTVVETVKGLWSGDEGTNGGIKGIINRFQSNLKNTYIKGKNSVPYLSGMKALLTGEPVGEWHLTVGNPLNPIAMIGNLICDNVEITFSDELGPDDFPIGFDAVVSLKHGMERDRDAIEAMFNRGAGRIYDLPDSMNLSSGSQTVVDIATRKDGYSGAFTQSMIPKISSSYSGKGATTHQTSDPVNHGSAESINEQNLNNTNNATIIGTAQTNGVITARSGFGIYILPEWIGKMNL